MTWKKAYSKNITQSKRNLIKWVALFKELIAQNLIIENNEKQIIRLF
jgi:hypothetical protein